MAHECGLARVAHCSDAGGTHEQPRLHRQRVRAVKVSARAAREEYGVIVRVIDGATFEIDAVASAALRTRLRAGRGARPFFDRGPGYRRLAGRDHADLDFR